VTVSDHETAEARRDLLRRAYAAYNAQDAAALAELVGDDVDWPDGGDGRLHGRAEVHAYWTEQWTRTRTHDEPLDFDDVDDGRSAVRIRQVVRALDGSLVSTGDFLHLLRVDGGLIRRLDIIAPRS
jgi:ketosteroid isomerase-like protein